MKKCLFLLFLIFSLIAIIIKLPHDSTFAQYSGSGGSCVGVGFACVNSGQCCSGNCSGGVCQNACGGNGTSCTNGPQCCSGYCNGSSTCADAPTPTPAPSVYTITGTVYVDANTNFIQDCNGVCNGGPGDEVGYSGASIKRIGPGVDPTITTGANGSFTFTNVNPGTYQLSLTIPNGYTNTTLAFVIVTVGPNATANFGIKLSAPTCSSVAANPTTYGVNTPVTANCTSTNPPITYGWPVPTPAGTGGNTGGNTNNTTYIPPADTGQCTILTARQNVTAQDSNGTATYGVNINVTPKNTLTGTIYRDNTGGHCSGAPAAYTQTAAVVSAFTAGNPTAEVTTNSNTANGTYTLNDLAACTQQKTIQLGGLAGGYAVDRVRIDGGAWTTTNLSNYTYGPFVFSSDHQFDWCVSSSAPWFQTGDGDIRSGNLNNQVPSGQSASTNPFSVFYSSGFNASFGGGLTPSGFIINNEYSYNDDPNTRQGLFSYDFFINRAKIKAVSLTPLTSMAGYVNCTGTSCTISNLPTGAYLMNSDLTITSYSHLPGSHVLLLVNGTANIGNGVGATSIKVPVGAGNLFILAAKNNINIAPNVGESTSTSTNTDIEGVYSAEGGITLQGTGCSTGSNPDLRLNLAGNFITNALKPFKVGGTGLFTNQRSLCPLTDATTPSFTIVTRYDFATQLTDFYKTPSIRWREVNP